MELMNQTGGKIAHNCYFRLYERAALEDPESIVMIQKKKKRNLPVSHPLNDVAMTLSKDLLIFLTAKWEEKAAEDLSVLQDVKLN